MPAQCASRSSGVEQMGAQSVEHTLIDLRRSGYLLAGEERQKEAMQNTLVVLDGALTQAAGLHRREVVGDRELQLGRRRRRDDSEASGRHRVISPAKSIVRWYRTFLLRG